MDEKLFYVNSLLDSLVTFLQNHEAMMRSHLNDFFCEDLQHYIDCTEDFGEVCKNIAALDCCLDETLSKGCHKYCQRKRKLTCSKSIHSNATKISGNTFLSLKKEHEVHAMSSCVHEMIESTLCPDVVDIGSGKGYLGSRLITLGNIQVLGVEGNSNCSESAENRKKQLEKGNTIVTEGEDTRRQTKTITYEISSATSSDSAAFVHLIQENMDNRDNLVMGMNDGRGMEKSGAILIGLHACGDLTAHTLELFANESYFRGLQIVGCCYNLCTEYSDDPVNFRFPMSLQLKERDVYLGKVARQLACQSPEKWSATEQELQKSLLYRAILQKMVSDENLDSKLLAKVKFRKIGKKSTSFVEYLDRVYKFLDSEDVIALSRISEEYYRRYAGRWPEMRRFHWLRMQLAPCIEKLIILDRLCYLLERGYCEATVVKMFETHLSPRCYAVVCEKT